MTVGCRRARCEPHKVKAGWRWKENYQSKGSIRSSTRGALSLPWHENLDAPSTASFLKEETLVLSGPVIPGLFPSASCSVLLISPTLCARVSASRGVMVSLGKQSQPAGSHEGRGRARSAVNLRCGQEESQYHWTTKDL